MEKEDEEKRKWKKNCKQNATPTQQLFVLAQQIAFGIKVDICN